MSTWARIQDNIALEIITTDPATSFHPTVAAMFSPVPDGTLAGATFAGGAWTNPAPVPPPEPIPVTPIYRDLTVGEFLLLFAPGERIAVRTSTDPVVQDWWYLIDKGHIKAVNPGNPAFGQTLLFLQSVTILTAERVAEITANAQALGLSPA